MFYVDDALLRQNHLSSVLASQRSTAIPAGPQLFINYMTDDQILSQEW